MGDRVVDFDNVRVPYGRQSWAGIRSQSENPAKWYAGNVDVSQIVRAMRCPSSSRSPQSTSPTGRCFRSRPPSSQKRRAPPPGRGKIGRKEILRRGVAGDIRYCQRRPFQVDADIPVGAARLKIRREYELPDRSPAEVFIVIADLESDPSGTKQNKFSIDGFFGPSRL
jgi:hypothetical protein